MILDIFQYDFMVRGLLAGCIVAVIAPLIGIFLVLRRYALIADTLAHVSLAGIAVGMLSGLPPVLTALGVTIGASLGIERLRDTRRIGGESALALFLSGSLALALVLLSLAHGFNTNLFSYLFGNILTVTSMEVKSIFALALGVILLVIFFYKELVFVSFDEEAARVSGIPTRFINRLLMVLTALAVTLAIPIVGVLLISALIVIPVVTALQLRVGFAQTLLWAEVISVISVVTGIILAALLNLSAGGTIVLLMLALFGLVLLTHE